jgi:MerR family redox-sensitive transcriptional activator SoxR
VSTVHFYEAKGLVSSRRSEGNQRRFSREVLRRIAVIRVALRAGIPLAQVRSAFSALPKDRAPTREDWKRLSAQWKDDLEARIRRLTRLRDELDGCIGCGCLSTTHCPLRNPGDVLAEQGPGPQLLERLSAGDAERSSGTIANSGEQRRQDHAARDRWHIGDRHNSVVSKCSPPGRENREGSPHAREGARHPSDRLEL